MLKYDELIGAEVLLSKIRTKLDIAKRQLIFGTDKVQKIGTLNWCETLVSEAMQETIREFDEEEVVK